MFYLKLKIVKVILREKKKKPKKTERVAFEYTNHLNITYFLPRDIIPYTTPVEIMRPHPKTLASDGHRIIGGIPIL